jgi:hypothetical protein
VGVEPAVSKSARVWAKRKLPTHKNGSTNNLLNLILHFATVLEIKWQPFGCHSFIILIYPKPKNELIFRS